MRAFQKCWCLSAVLRAFFITECLLTKVKGDGADSEEKPDIKYALIGGGIGLLLAAGFIIIKMCIIRKQVTENSTELRDLPRHPSQSEHHVEERH